MGSRKAPAIVALSLAGAALAACGRVRTPPLAEPEPEPEARGAAGRSLAGEGTGSVTVVDGDELKGTSHAQLEDFLEGRVAGVQVIRQPGGGISVRIRGPGSLDGDMEPLYVVDGMPVRVRAGRGLDWLNPGDIARIEVLKDAATTSMYGVQGANGVVLITTRKGKRKLD
jgi:TonB-dependent SusC/RagA subfamily outer membrane receptor